MDASTKLPRKKNTPRGQFRKFLAEIGYTVEKLRDCHDSSYLIVTSRGQISLALMMILQEMRVRVLFPQFLPYVSIRSIVNEHLNRLSMSERTQVDINTVENISILNL